MHSNNFILRLIIVLGLLVASLSVAAQPSVTLNPVAAINEGDQANLIGSFTEPNLALTHAVEINWGDPLSTGGNNSNFALPASSVLSVGDTFNSSTDAAVLSITAVNAGTGEIGFSVPQQYLDDNPSGTPSDNYQITVTVSDPAANTALSIPVTVNNVAPNLGSLAVPSPVEEGVAMTLSGVLDDPGTLDNFLLSVDWGDGGAVENFNYPAGTTGIDPGHSYASVGNYTIVLTLVDDDTGQASTTFPVSVVAPIPPPPPPPAPTPPPEAVPALGSAGSAALALLMALAALLALGATRRDM